VNAALSACERITVKNILERTAVCLELTFNFYLFEESISQETSTIILVIVDDETIEMPGRAVLNSPKTREITEAILLRDVCIELSDSIVIGLLKTI
jgi:hypothetical protein